MIERKNIVNAFLVIFIISWILFVASYFAFLHFIEKPAMETKIEQPIK